MNVFARRRHFSKRFFHPCIVLIGKIPHKFTVAEIIGFHMSKEKGMTLYKN